MYTKIKRESFESLHMGLRKDVGIILQSGIYVATEKDKVTI